MITTGALMICSFLAVGAYNIYDDYREGKLNTTPRIQTDNKQATNIKESIGLTTVITNVLWMLTLFTSILSAIKNPILFTTPLPQITIGILAMDAVIAYCSSKEFKIEEAYAKERSDLSKSERA